MQKNNFLLQTKDYLIKAYPELLIIVISVIVDLVSKFIISHALKVGESITLIPKFLHFTYVKNTKAAFSFDFGLSELIGAMGVRIFFIVFTFLALGLFFYMLIKAKGGHKLYRVSLALIIGGAIGNLYDRIFYGFVRDFVDIEYFGLTVFGSTHFAIFNIADSALVVGVILLAAYFIFLYKEPVKESTEQLSLENNVAGEDGQGKNITDTESEISQEVSSEDFSEEKENMAENEIDL